MHKQQPPQPSGDGTVSESSGGSISLAARDAHTNTLLTKVRDKITGHAGTSDIVDGLLLKAAIDVASNLPEDGTIVSDAAIERAMAVEVDRRDAAIGELEQRLDARLKRHEVPIGGIILWSGVENAVPKNWIICNGQQGSPDLRNRFIVGAGADYVAGQIGGALRQQSSSDGNHDHPLNIDIEGHALTQAEMPAHSHFSVAQITNHSGINIDIRRAVAHVATGIQWSGPGRSINNEDYVLGGTRKMPNTGLTSNTGASRAHTHNAAGSLGNSGNHSHSLDVRPPYYAVAFIMRIA